MVGLTRLTNLSRGPALGWPPIMAQDLLDLEKSVAGCGPTWFRRVPRAMNRRKIPLTLVSKRRLCLRSWNMNGTAGETQRRSLRSILAWILSLGARPETFSDILRLKLRLGIGIP